MLRRLLTLLACFACAACSPRDPGPAAASPPSICLASYNIDRTDIPDDGTIVFTMRDHSVYLNRLVQRCPGLRNDTRGFTYEPTNPDTDEICSNLLTIRLNTYGSICMLGAFEKIMPAARS